MENSSEFFYEKLRTANNPGAILASMYCTLYDKTPSRSEIIMCNKLVKVFGRFTTFFAILDMAGSYSEGTDTPYPLLYKICRNKFETAHSDSSAIQSRESLDKYINNVNEVKEKLARQKIRVPSSKGLAKDVRE